ncbi:MAG TPA: hypothetical protein VKX49_06755 [Bryobacteraceae bacterium]|nr:hypothetical protein [Bryobacteraceae bacterium]
MASSTQAEFHRYAVWVAIYALALIAVGAYVTSLASAPQLASHSVLNASIHRLIGVVLLILALFLALWQAQSDETPLLGCTALAALLFESWLGWTGSPVLHASFAPVAFSILAATALAASSVWDGTQEVVEDFGTPILRRIVIAGPVLVILQILLGAAYRHKLTGVLPHLAGAMIVSLAALMSAMLVMRQFPSHRILRFSAASLLWTLLAQVALGVGALALQLLNLGNSALIFSTTLHVVVGSLTLASSLVLSMAFQRYVRRAKLAS